MRVQAIHALPRRVVAITVLGVSLALGACAMTGSPGSSAASSSSPASASNGVFVNGTGMTLYTFDKDVAGSGKSVCNGPCAQLWPAFTPGADAKASGDWTIVTRDDGAKQWAYKGKPVYAFSRDTAPGERKGDRYADNWSLAKP